MNAQLKTFAEIDQRHKELTEQHDAEQLKPEDRQQFVNTIIAAGAFIETGRDRERLGRMLVYWSTIAMAESESVHLTSPPRLAPFQGETSQTTNRNQPSRKMANISALQLPSMTSENLGRTTRLIRLAATARHWRRAPDSMKQGILLSGSALEEAAEFSDEDADIRDYVHASKEQELEHKHAKMKLGGLVAVLAIGALAVSGWYYNQNDKLKAEAILAEGKAALAKATALQQTELNVARAIQDDIRQRAKDAVDQFSATNPAERSLNSLRKFLKEIGEASDSELGLLVLREDPAFQQKAMAEGVRTVQLPPAPAPASGRAACEAAMWFGSDNDKNLELAGSLASIRPGQTFAVKTRAEIRLRQALPSDEYTMAPPVGSVPNGAVITVTGDVKSYLRGSIPTLQYWASVRTARQHCVRVFLQYTGPDAKLGAMREALLRNGVQVPPPESIARAEALAEVRYFWSDDAEVAEQTANSLQIALADGRRISVKPLLNFPTKPAKGVIEAWVDLSGK